MNRASWTLMLVPNDNSRVRALRLTARGIRLIVCLAVLGGLLATSLSIGFLFKQGQDLRAKHLKKENALLAAEVDQMRSEMEQLSASLDTLSQRDSTFRVIAGLPVLDSAVQLVGIGGPGTTVRSSAVLADSATGDKLAAADYDLRLLSRRAALLHESMEEATHTMRKNTARLDATPSISPSSGHLSSLFSKSRRHPTLRIIRPHEGIDIAAPVGEPIHAPSKGRVVFAGNKPGGFGLTVEIDHGYGYLTRYAHASRLLVRKGDRVERGEMIAEVGQTGLVSGPHLHYEVEVHGKAVDPLNFIIDGAVAY